MTTDTNIETDLKDGELSRFVRLQNKRPTQKVEEAAKALDFDTIIFIGSGAIANGWKPIAALCQDIIDGKVPAFTSYDKNNVYFYNEPHDHFLTSFAFLETAIRSRIAKGIEDPAFLQGHFWKAYSNAIAGKEVMANLFKNEKTLSLRTLDYTRYGLDLEKTVVVTSNWDDCVWSEKSFKNVIYLHGHCCVQNSLILPTQFITDEFPLKYWLDLRLTSADPNQPTALKNATEVAKIMRAKPNQFSKGRDVQLEINHAHDLFRELISGEKLKKIFVWGYGFNLYDAEVNFLLTLASLTNPPRTVEILNPDPSVLLKASQVLAREIKDIGYHHPSK